ncbi:DNA-binding NarL/FixJ family response regulator [Aquimarina sp. EL_43]|uniref:response regulator transcription factor n=1 Tax=unclassified Aquimarina TaxID=2627091 RepID=UPI0018C99470|nr:MULTISPECIES: response regulator transcription factor [unclassified Aquimarina]MBG6131618.1 DNA-binding NarL/FixJ family response regulator [Aquimarina sp. EL_35]MBG6152079.1 DNA-binding NarL/FixJ family response regulator [Aquimarina sp. EL_32]MBG6169977.1 DNA-binding NarL/FixJ family response regulator [Aquimarina sp. EL_43]
METPVKIMIIDDHQMFIDGIKSLLRKEEYLQIVSEYLCAEDALEQLEKDTVDIIITDISMPGMSGIELIKTIKSTYSNLKVLVLSMHNDKEVVSEIMMSEADGYILKNTGKQELIEALTRITDNGTYYSKEVLSVMVNKVKKERKIEAETNELTDREVKVLELICQEYSSQEIADKLFIGRRTVDTHRQNILRKTKVKTIVGLIKYGIRNGFTSDF